MVGIITLEADFCIGVVEAALERHGSPEIINTARGSQFTSTERDKVLAASEIKISLPLGDCTQSPTGARWQGRVAGKCLRRAHARTINYEDVYLCANASLSEARAGIGRYLTFYNGGRPRSSFDRKSLDQAYFNLPMPEAVAA